jgi:hypothetical protein
LMLTCIVSSYVTKNGGLILHRAPKFARPEEHGANRPQ